MVYPFPKRLSSKLKSFNHKGHKGFAQRSQSSFPIAPVSYRDGSYRNEIHRFNFVCFEPSLSSLWLNKTI
jgi:hypothetical protein